jgi:hypothetical protein
MDLPLNGNSNVHIYTIREKQDNVEKIINSLTDSLFKTIEENKISGGAILIVIVFLLIIVIVKKNVIRFLQSLCKKKETVDNSQNSNNECTTIRIRPDDRRDIKENEYE